MFSTEYLVRQALDYLVQSGDLKCVSILFEMGDRKLQMRKDGDWIIAFITSKCDDERTRRTDFHLEKRELRDVGEEIAGWVGRRVRIR